jgi:hypothetical protein
MMIMPGNNSSPPVHYLAGAHPGLIGWIIGPKAVSHTKLRSWMPYALDNDAFSAYFNKTEWDETLWLEMLRWADLQDHPPLWVLVPDKVADRETTLLNWDKYAPEAGKHGPLAFASQDGMEPSDVPKEAQVVFMGGSTEWKWSNLAKWASIFPRMHVGRVNTIKKLTLCKELGIESVDGGNWFLGGEKTMMQMVNFLKT